MSISSILQNPNNPNEDPDSWTNLNVNNVNSNSLISGSLDTTDYIYTPLLNVDQIILTSDITGPGAINATKIQSIPVASDVPTDGQILAYNAGNAQLEYTDQSGMPVFNPITVDLYWNESTGLDTNDGLTALTPVQSWAKIQEIGSGYNVQQITIHMWAQNYSTYASAMDSSFTNPIFNRTYANIWDIRPLGCSIVKLITDQGVGTSENISTKQAYQPVNPGVPANNISFDNITHNALGITPLFTYFPTVNRYAAIGAGSTSTSSNLYSYNTAPLAGVAAEFYNDTLAKPQSQFLMLGDGKQVILERISFTSVAGGFGLFGNKFDMLGCPNADLVSCSGYLTMEGCSGFRLEYCNQVILSNCGVSNTIAYINSLSATGCQFSSSISYSRLFLQNCIVRNNDSFSLVQCNGLIDLFACEAGVSTSSSTTGFILTYCLDLTLTRMYPYQNHFILQNSKIVFGNLNGSSTLYLVAGSHFNMSDSTLAFWGGNEGLEMKEGSSAIIETSTLSDLSTSSANPIFSLVEESRLKIYGNVSIATPRSGNLMDILSESHVYISGNLAFPTATSHFQPIQVVRQSTLSANQINVNANGTRILYIDIGSIVYVGAITNSGSSTNVRKGTINYTIATCKNTTYSSVVSGDTMCLIINR